MLIGRTERGQSVALLPRDRRPQPVSRRVPRRRRSLIIRVGRHRPRLEPRVVQPAVREDSINGVARDLGRSPMLVLVVVDGVGGAERLHLRLLAFGDVVASEALQGLEGLAAHQVLVVKDGST